MTEQTRIDTVQQRISDALARLRGEYRRAVQSPEDNTLSWFGMPFFVDQLRYLVVPAAQVGDRWERRDGKAFLRNRPVPVVDIYVGPGRSFIVHDFMEIMHALAVDGAQPFMDESSLGHFLSLMVVEPDFNPLAETTTLLAVAHALAQGRYNDNIFRRIPPTIITERDIGAIPGFDLEQHARRLAGDIAQRELELVKTIKPVLLQEIDRLLVEHDHTEVIGMLKDELRDYVRAQVFAPLAGKAEDIAAP